MIFKIILLMLIAIVIEINARVRFEDLENKEEIIVNPKRDQFRYVPAIRYIHKDCFEFWVRAPSAIQISLSNAPQYIDPKINIVLGDHSNMKSAIYINGTNFWLSSTPNILDTREYRSFWIKWSIKGKIWVGKGDEIMPFMVFESPEQFYPINFIGIASIDSEASFVVNEGNFCKNVNKCLEGGIVTKLPKE
ncbi:uncharacterized protein LOC129618557 [Condylostylus longicornis]|uniref:uncharacterized protein LOC129618557 n=1 Tax=Condylostylus longicornis TaxID=2530218 RepID=UPI00244E0061|nr:uncharacterized protein LOC129618557 [Condylostylus longicornis]